ncbi:MAG: membrane lipoprotein lipid attachment site-containing protein, partial [Bacilli bacterium]|nr:membrane lipoprotein lipid attachment site-containing protein [Bacilli bacterium]
MRKITFGILGALLLTACGGGGGDTVSQTSSSSRSVSISTSRSYTQQEKENFLLNDMDIDSDGIRYTSLYERYIDRS